MSILNQSQLRRLRFVPRWSVVPTIKSQNVAEHAFHVMCIFIHLCDKMGYVPDMLEIKKVLAHDQEEAVIGDIPSPAKNEEEVLVSVFTVLLKIADTLEALMFVDEDKAFGNTSLEAIDIYLTAKLNKWLYKLEPGVREKIEEAILELGDVINPSVHPCLVAK